MSDQQKTIAELKAKIAHFVNERDWEQFHSPKNLSMSIAIEAAELMEHFQWAKEHEAKQVVDAKRKEIEEEIADIAMFLFEFCNLYGIDLSSAMEDKLLKNAHKYPRDLVKGKSKKYTEYITKKS